MTWKNAPEIIDKKYIGFVYEIKDKENNKKYIGIKKFWKKTKKGLKESDWKTYNSSGVMKDIIKNNPKRFNKKIIYMCETITEMKLRETYIQLTYYFTGKWDLLYNEVVNVRLRVRKKGVKK
jgi:hypothetical protein